MSTAMFRIWRGEKGKGGFKDYKAEVGEGMVVLDVVHQIQAEQANDLAVRWNCKAGKCGSCSAEVNGMPKLMCMTRMSDIDTSQPVTIEPMHAFPNIDNAPSNAICRRLGFELLEKCEFEFPKGHFMTCNDWRLDLGA